MLLLRYAPKKNFPLPFNGTEWVVPFPFNNILLSVPNPFEVRAYFPSVLIYFRVAQSALARGSL